MRYLFFVLVLAGVFCFSGYAGAAEPGAAEVTVTTGIRDRMPVDAVESYAAKVESLFCFSRITGAVEDTTIWHVWYLGEKEMARIGLPVRSENWRTWSNKAIPAGAQGHWRVEVLDDQGNMLASKSFLLM